MKIFLRATFQIFAATFLLSTCLPALASPQPDTSAAFQSQLVAFETVAGGRLGLYAVNTGNNTSLQYRGDERFPFCSTFKVIGVAAILKQSMTNKGLLDQKVTYSKQDLVNAYSPITQKHLTDGMTISGLCSAAIMYSDDTAINLIIKQLGGVKAVNTFAHSIGDKTFRLDRTGPTLNTAEPGDERDTTSPAAMAQSLQSLVLGNVLAEPQRDLLQTWLKDNTTGANRIRAGVPKDWIVGDKTGTGDYGTSNDIGVIWPKGCAPIVIAVYFTQSKKDATPQDGVIAAATRAVIEEFTQNDPCLKKQANYS